MIIQPKIRGFICTTAHPEGCEAVVKQQIHYVKSRGSYAGPKNVLIIGASTGYGLASRIDVAFGAGAKTIGVFFEKEADQKRTASPGWYNTAAFEKVAHAENIYAKSINGDAFSHDIKQKTAALIQKDLGKVDLIVYSLASPRRIHPDSGEVFSSVLKPVGHSFTGKTIDVFRGEIREITIDPANQEEIDHTISVMGGEDWKMWVDYLISKDLLSERVKTVAYSYLGPELTHAIYKDGTIGKAKEHLKMTADQLNKDLKKLQGEAFISVDKAVVTQASAAIPVVPLYISLLFKVMKENGLHEGCIEQMDRLFRNHLYALSPLKKDAEGFIRLDDKEMMPAIQAEVMRRWQMISTDNLMQLADIEGYRDEFYKLFGFNVKTVHYEDDINPNVRIPSIAL